MSESKKPGSFFKDMLSRFVPPYDLNPKSLQRF
jgi:hypothetical protein